EPPPPRESLMTSTQYPTRTKQEWSDFLRSNGQYTNFYKLIDKMVHFQLGLVDQLKVPNEEAQREGAPVSFHGRAAGDFSNKPVDMAAGQTLNGETWFRFAFRGDSFSDWLTTQIQTSASSDSAMLLNKVLVPFTTGFESPLVILSPSVDPGVDETGRKYLQGTNFYTTVDVAQVPLMGGLFKMLSLNSVPVEIYFAGGPDFASKTPSFVLQAGLKVNRGIWHNRLLLKTLALTLDHVAVQKAGVLDAVVLGITFDFALPETRTLSMAGAAAFIDSGTAPYWQFTAAPQGNDKTIHPLGMDNISLTVDSVTIKTRGLENIGVDGQGSASISHKGKSAISGAEGFFYLDKTIDGFTGLQVSADSTELGVLSDALTDGAFNISSFLKVGVKKPRLFYANISGPRVDITVDGTPRVHEFKAGWELSGMLDLWGWKLDIEEATYSKTNGMSLKANAPETLNLGVLSLSNPTVDISASKQATAFGVTCQVKIAGLYTTNLRLPATMKELSLPKNAAGFSLSASVDQGGLSQAQVEFHDSWSANLSFSSIQVSGFQVFPSMGIPGLQIGASVKLSIKEDSLQATVTASANVHIVEEAWDIQVKMSISDAGSLNNMRNAVITAIQKAVNKKLQAFFDNSTIDAIMKVLYFFTSPLYNGKILKNAYKKTEKEIGEIFKTVGYDAWAAGSALQGIYNQTAKQVKELLDHAGYEAKEVEKTIKKLFP
ncbi:MAG: hypothetical protein ACI8RZ_005371, partial [Myxococcota bacterium]